MNQPDRAQNDRPKTTAFERIFKEVGRDIAKNVAGMAQEAGQIVHSDLDKAESLLKGVLEKAELGKGAPRVAESIDKKITNAGFTPPDEDLLLRFLPNPDATTKPTKADQLNPVTQIFNEVRSDMLSEVTEQTNKGREAFSQGQHEEGQQAIEKSLGLLQRSRGIDDLAAEIITIVNDKGYTFESGLLQRSAIMLSEELTPRTSASVSTVEEIPTPSEGPTIQVEIPIHTPIAQELVQPNQATASESPVQISPEAPSEAAELYPKTIEDTTIYDDELRPVEDFSALPPPIPGQKPTASQASSVPIDMKPTTSEGPTSPSQPEASVIAPLPAWWDEYRTPLQDIKTGGALEFTLEEGETTDIIIERVSEVAQSMGINLQINLTKRGTVLTQTIEDTGRSTSERTALEGDDARLKIFIEGNELIYGDSRIEVTPDQTTILLRLPDASQRHAKIAELREGLFPNLNAEAKFNYERAKLAMKLRELTGRDDLIDAVYGRNGGLALKDAVVSIRESVTSAPAGAPDLVAPTPNIPASETTPSPITPSTPEVEDKNSPLKLVLEGNILRRGNEARTLTDDQVTMLLRLPKQKGEYSKRQVIGNGIIVDDEKGNNFARVFNPLRAILTELGGRDLITSLRSSKGGYALDRVTLTRRTEPDTPTETPAPISPISEATPSETTSVISPVETQAPGEESFKLVLEGGVLIVGNTRFPINNSDKMILSKLAEGGNFASQADIEKGFHSPAGESITEYMYRLITRLNRAAGKQVIKKVTDGWAFNNAEYVQPGRDDKTPPSERKDSEKLSEARVESSAERAKTDISETHDRLLRDLFSFNEDTETYNFSTTRSAIADAFGLNPDTDAEQIRTLEAQLIHGGDLRDLVSTVEKGRQILETGRIEGSENLVELVQYIDGLTYKGRALYKDQHTGSLLKVVTRDKSFIEYAHDIVNPSPTRKIMGGGHRAPKRNGGRRNL